MQPATFTSRDFNQNPSRIKRAAKDGTVIITERDRPDLVVMSYSAYTDLTGKRSTFLERIAMPDVPIIDLDTTLPATGPRAAELD